MMAEIHVALSPVEHATQLVLTAFDTKHKRNKAAHRVLGYILHLAEARGYQHVTDFKYYFGHPEQHSVQHTQRMLQQLFEFVSADEVLEFARPLQL